MPELRFMKPAAVGTLERYNNSITRNTPFNEPSHLGWETRSVKFSENAIEPMRGHLIHAGTNMDIAGNYLYPVKGNKDYIVIFTTAVIEAMDSSSSPGGVVITRASGAYTGVVADIWSGTYLNGVVVFTNNVDLPQLWLPIADNTLLIDLPNWPASTYAKRIIAYKNFLVAVNITKGSTNFPTLVKWSNVAFPGTAPTSWDETDATVDAGEFALTSTQGDILDIVPLRDSLIIYKTNSVIRMQWVGGQDVFRWDTLSESHGLLAQGCAVEYKPGWHVFISSAGKVVKHNGQTFTELATETLGTRFKKYFYPLLGIHPNASVAVDSSRNSVYFAYNRSASGVNYSRRSEILIWNYELDIWSDEALYGLQVYQLQTGTRWLDGTPGPGVAPGSSVWATDSQSPYTLFQLNNEEADFIPVSFITDWMTFGSLDRQGQMIEEPDKIKLIKTLRPIITWEEDADTSPLFRIRIYSMEKPGGAITLVSDDPSFDPTIETVLSPNATVVYYRIWFGSLTTGDRATSSWRFLGYVLDLEIIGNVVDAGTV